MKPSIALSEEAIAKLRNILEIRGFDSLESTAEFVIAEGERKALLIKKLYDHALPDEAWEENARHLDDAAEPANGMLKAAQHNNAG